MACLSVPPCDPKPLRALLEQMAKERPAVFALVIPGESPAVMLLRTKGAGPDLGAALRQLLQSFPGKGGGSPVLAQATLEPATDPAGVLEKLKTLL
jgi:alanyl-tRNA synthetase